MKYVKLMTTLVMVSTNCRDKKPFNPWKGFLPKFF